MIRSIPLPPTHPSTPSSSLTPHSPPSFSSHTRKDQADEFGRVYVDLASAPCAVPSMPERRVVKVRGERLQRPGGEPRKRQAMSPMGRGWSELTFGTCSGYFL